MFHTHEVKGVHCKLRPVRLADAQYIVDTRNDPDQSLFLNEVSEDVSAQRKWLKTYFDRENDYYFVVENASGFPSGLIALYDIKENVGEWGRWIIKGPPTVSVESALLIYKFAFEVIGLDSVYCRTIANNINVVSFHDSCGLPQGALLKDAFFIRERYYDAIEHSLTKVDFPSVRSKLERVLRLPGVSE